MFFDGHGFAGQRRLADEEVLRADQADIRRNNRASLEDNNVSWHDFRYRDVTFFAIAEDQASGFHHGLKLFDGLAGTVLLHMCEHDAEQDHGSDNGRRADISHQERDRADHEELDDERIMAPLQEFHHNAGFFSVTENIAAVFLRSGFDLLVRKAMLRHPKTLQRFLYRQRAQLH